MAKNKLLDKNVLRTFPKIELHRHLEGTYPLDKLYEMAKKNNIEVPGDLEVFIQDNRFPKGGKPDFLLFLSKFKNHWYRSLEDVAFITYHSVKTFAVDNLFYIELRFNPEHYAAFNNFNRADVTKAVIDAANQAGREIGVRIKYLITFNRGKQSEDELIALYDSIKSVSKDICGYDLAGDETKYPPQTFARLFSKIEADGKKVTIHAGEVSPPQQIWDSIEILKASRIGHGTNSISDVTLQEFLTKKNIILEQCLTSNHQTGSWVDTATHPFGRLFRAGVPVTLNSDDPHIQDTDLTDDYILAVKHFQLSLEDLVKTNLTAIEGAFLSKAERASLKKDYLAAVEQFKINHQLS